MHTQLLKYASEQALFEEDSRVLLTVSGGIDSVVMVHLFAKAGIDFGIAHCNFCLRGQESDGDAAFVEKLAQRFQVPFYLKTCDASAYAKAYGVSIQMAARDLRFAWFEELIKEQGYTAYATAHHADDAIETYLINQLRGTGISGLHGLLPKNGNLIHPLLFATRNDIKNYVKEQGIAYREDSSNKSTKYMRNSLRHQVLPVFETLQPNYREVLLKNMQRFAAVEHIYQQEIEAFKQMHIQKKEDCLQIPFAVLKTLPYAETYLYEIIKVYGFAFSHAEEMMQSLSEGVSGAQFFSDNYRILRDREHFVLSELPAKEKAFFMLNEKEGKTEQPIGLEWKCTTDKTLVADPKTALLDFDKLQFPLVLRKWEKGDFFVPLGMKGKKHLSDFFIDSKLSLIEKEKVWLLVSGRDIVWVVGQRIDDRYKVQAVTTQVLNVRLLPR